MPSIYTFYHIFYSLHVIDRIDIEKMNLIGVNVVVMTDQQLLFLYQDPHNCSIEWEMLYLEYFHFTL